MSERSNIVWLRVVALTIALLLWFFVTLEHRGERPAEKVVEAAVTYNPPPGMIILDPIEKVRVRLRGSEQSIRRINPYVVDVQVDLAGATQGRVDVRLDPENVLLPENLEVVSIEPPYLQLRLDREMRRRLPVRPRLTGEPAAGSEVAGEPVVTPPAVVATGPEQLLRAISYLETSPVSLDGHALDFEETTLVLSPDPLVKITNAQIVSVFVPMRQPSPTPDANGPERNR